MKNIKPIILIVGAFPPASSKVFGGVIYNCSLLRESFFYNRFDIIEFDTTQSVIPFPPVIHRFFASLRRIIRFFILLLMITISKRRPSLVIFFAALAPSFLEKSLCSLLCKFFLIKSAIYPLGCQLIADCNRSYMLYLSIIFASRFSTFIFSQGSIWKHFFAYKCGIEHRRIFTLRSWTSTPELQSKYALVNLRINKTIAPLNFVYSGWLVKEKGVLELCSAFIMYINSGNVGHLTFIGSGPMKSELINMVTAAGMSPYFSFLGQFSHQDTISYLFDYADVFVLPSYNEGIPNSLIEASSMGIPSIVSRVGCIPDYFLENSVIYVRPKHQGDLFDAFVYVNSKSVRISLSNLSFDCAVKNFSTDDVISELSNFIISV